MESWLATPPPPGALRLMLAPQATQALHGIAPPAPGAALELLIGAEGGLAPEEMQMALLAGFVGVRLGPRILRTETAGLAALAAIQCLWGDFREGQAHV
jgi:16S rRNA (uracil1498-N3)-methyltransferase